MKSPKISKNTGNFVLPDTSLCAIVRDEMMNPAGGIERFVNAHVPYVEEAIIADTGSVDGTREKLEELQGKYSNLRVVDIPFEDYASARNESLVHVRTKRALILDADELLTHDKPQNDWQILKEIIEEQRHSIYSFEFLTISPSGKDYNQLNVHNKRLFNVNHFSNREIFMGEFWESLSYMSKGHKVHSVQIKHFVPSNEDTEKKHDNWYLALETNSVKERDALMAKRLKLWKQTSPSQIEGFNDWKQYNPIRDNYI